MKFYRWAVQWKRYQGSPQAWRGSTAAMFFAVAAMLFVIPAPGLSQGSPTGALAGVVVDPSGAVLPGVTVVAKGSATGLTRETVSGGGGEWRIANLPVGVYEITFELDGFRKLVRSTVNVEAAVTRSLNVTLEVGSISESVTVSADAPLLTPTAPTTARSLTSEELEAVPTSTGSFTHLLSSEAGVSSDLPPVLTNGTGNISPSVNGTRTTSTSLFFNGIDATNLTTNEGSMSDNVSPMTDTLQEVKLQTSMYDASTGRSGGGNFQLVTRSGSNAFRGSALYNLQNEALNANDYFYEKDGIEKPKARRNEGGFTIGGPVRQNRFFFFGGYQRTQAETGFVPTASSITVLPQALQLIQGDRTKENLLAAFGQFNPSILQSIPKAQCTSPSDRACVSDVALNLLNLRNPVTGDFMIPAPRPGAALVGNDINVAGSNGGNPLLRQRNVVPAEFTQDQYTLKLDGQLAESNRLSGTVFFANFPGLDPFPDPFSLASPVTLRRADRNVTVAISDTQIWGTTKVNEMRGGVFDLRNSRRLDDDFLGITNASVGVDNPATFFDNSDATNRLGHYVGRPGGIMERFSFGGPNDTFNQRQQRTLTFGDTLSWTTDRHAMRMGGEFRHNEFNTNLPEEQATEFEKFDNFTQLLRGVSTEADTQFGITDKQFRFNDFGFFLADDWKLSRSLTLNLGVRYEFFGLPTEVNGHIGNVDFDAITNAENPVNAFIVPNNVQLTGFNAIDAAINASERADNKHTLNGQDWNNVAPRLGFAWSPTDRWVVRGGYGIFYDRPSAAFINTVFSNYPFLREQEVTFPAASVPLQGAWSQQDPNYPFNQYLPNKVVRNTNGTYQIRDGTLVTRGADGTINPTNPATNQPFTGNVAETFEFRAIDRDLHSPYVQQFNFGVQREFGANLMLEVRYVGSRGDELLEARAFNQGYDLNDPATPDYIYQRFNDAYVAAGSPNGALNAGTTAKQQGVGKAFGFANPGLNNMIDYNLSTGGATGAVIPFEARAPILGFNIPEAVLLANTGRSLYNSFQLNLLKRMSSGLQYNLAYTYSRSKDTSSVDPGSTSGSGKPDTPNAGFVVQGDNRNIDANYALSDFDRPHRFSGSFIWDIPGQGALNGFRVSGYVQMQSGLPYSIFSAEPELQNASQYGNLVRGSGGIYRLGFGRPSLCGSLDDLRQAGPDPTEAAFNASVLCSPSSIAGGYPGNLGFGNLGRNELRGFWQRRVDLSFAKSFGLRASRHVEVRWDIFNVFNTVNYALPNNTIGDAGTDFGKITDSVGGPRVMQFGLRFHF